MLYSCSKYIEDAKTWFCISCFLVYLINNQIQKIYSGIEFAVHINVFCTSSLLLLPFSLHYNIKGTRINKQVKKKLNLKSSIVENII